ncbi:MFS transporter [Sulfurimonas sp.]
MKNIDKNVIYLGWVSFFTDMASSMVTTLLPIFVIFVLGEGVDKLGVIIAVATFVSYALRVLFGYLSDKYQIVKPFVVAGYLISAITKPLLAYTHTFSSITLLRSLERMGKAIRSASKDSLISSYTKDGRAGKTFGFHKMMDVSGELSGALIIMFVFYFTLQNEEHIRDIFAWTLLPGLLATLIVLIFVKDAPKQIKKEKKVIDKKDYRLFALLFSYFFFLFFLMSDQYFIVEAKVSGMTLSQIPLLVIASTLTQTLSSYYSGALIDKIGERVMLLVAYIFGIFSILALWQHFFWLAFIFLGLFSVVSLNALRAYISQNAQSKAFIYGVLYGGIAIFSALGAFVIGQIWHRYDFESMILFSSFGTIGVAFFTLFIMVYTFVKKR